MNKNLKNKMKKYYDQRIDSLEEIQPSKTLVDKMEEDSIPKPFFDWDNIIAYVVAVGSFIAYFCSDKWLMLNQLRMSVNLKFF